MSRKANSLGTTNGTSSPFEPCLPIRFLATCLTRLGCIRERKYLDKGWKSYAENLQFKILRLFYTFTSRDNLDCLMQQLDDIRSSRLFEHLSCNHKERHEKTSEGLSFKHSGNAGDVIYALPVIRELSKEHPATIYLNLDSPINRWSLHQHPLGNSGLTKAMFAFLKPLLQTQSWVNSVKIHKGELINYDLDIFRKISSIRAGRGHIAHWYFWIFPIASNLSNPWLEASPLERSGERIVLARSSRYQNPHLNYSFLQEVGEIDFIGTKSEFDEMQRILPNLNHIICSDALHMAQIIKSARFFIGNQSFPFAIAEALKVPRILEVCPHTPDVIPTGNHFGTAYFQPNFEVLVRQFIERHTRL